MRQKEDGHPPIRRSLAERLNHQYLPRLSVGSHNTFDYVTCFVTHSSATRKPVQQGELLVFSEVPQNDRCGQP